MPRHRTTIRRAADLLTEKNVPIARAAVVLAREPESPVTQAIKLWGDDEEPFKNLIAAETPLARRWRRTMRQLISHLERDKSGNTVYRGWNFESARARAAFLAPILEQGFFLNARIGMSATLSPAIATGTSFLNRFGTIWEIRAPRTAPNVAPIFEAIGAKFPDQREVIFSRGAQFGLLGQPATTTVVRGRQILRVPYLVFEEI